MLHQHLLQPKPATTDLQPVLLLNKIFLRSIFRCHTTAGTHYSQLRTTTDYNAGATGTTNILINLTSSCNGVALAFLQAARVRSKKLARAPPSISAARRHTDEQLPRRPELVWRTPGPRRFIPDTHIPGGREGWKEFFYNRDAFRLVFFHILSPR